MAVVAAVGVVLADGVFVVVQEPENKVALYMTSTDMVLRGSHLKATVFSIGFLGSMSVCG